MQRQQAAVRAARTDRPARTRDAREERARLGAASNGLTARARDLEQALVAILVDRGAYLAHRTAAELRRDLARLRVRPRGDDRCVRMLVAIERLADRGERTTIEAVGREAGIAVAHVARLVGEVWDAALVDLEAIQKALLDARRRIEVATIGRALVCIAKRHDLDVRAHCERLADELRRVQA